MPPIRQVDQEAPEAIPIPADRRHRPVKIIIWPLSTEESATAGYGFSYWDCQIAAAALEGGCDTRYPDDLQSGQVIDGSLLVSNPFALGVD